MGALDVCPFIPVQNVTMEECVECAKEFGEKLAIELGVPGIVCVFPSPQSLHNLWDTLSGVCICLSTLMSIHLSVDLYVYPSIKNAANKKTSIKKFIPMNAI